MGQRPKTMLLDFDGVLHNYASGWQGVAVIEDPPVEGAMEFLRALLEDERFDVCIYSSRSSDVQGQIAMQRWLVEHWPWGMLLLDKIKWPIEKPPGFLTIDDRAICFDGTWPSLDDIESFKPWHQL